MKTIAELMRVGIPVPFSFNKQADCSFPDLIMGMEIEIENCARGINHYTKLVQELGWDVTTDGSLRGDNAFEFVSKPFKLSNLIESVKDFYQVTKFVEEQFTDRCSIHVHINCTDLTVDHVSTFALVYAVFEEALFDFIGHDRDTNIYCIPWNQCRYNKKLITNLKEHLFDVPRTWQKYTAVNLVPLQTQGTLEFRHMHGTADIEKITQWLNIIGCLFKYSKENNFLQVYEIIKSINAISNYEQFFTTLFGEYWRFNEEIMRKLEEGVMSAKYALINFDPTKKIELKAKEKAKTLSYTNIFNTVILGDDQLLWDVAPQQPLPQVNLNNAPHWVHRIQNPTADRPFRGMYIFERADRGDVEYELQHGRGFLLELRYRENQLGINNLPLNFINTEGRTY